MENKKRIIIAGMGVASAAAATAIQQTNRDAEVVIVEKRKDYDTFSPCAMPFALEGKLKFSELKHGFPSRGRNTIMMKGCEAMEILPKEKKLKVKSIETGSEDELSFDSLIVSTGSKPIIPKVQGIEGFIGGGAYTIDNPENAELVYSEAKKCPGKRAVVIGAGAIGIETAYALKRQGLDVVVAEALQNAFPKALDADVARLVEQYLASEGIKVMTQKLVSEIKGSSTIEAVRLGDEEMEASIIISACGIKPNTGMIKDGRIAVTPYGISTSRKMQTSMPCIYAAGDCAETFNAMTRKKCGSGLATAAYRQGYIAGINAAGGNRTYAGTINTFISVIGNKGAGAAGLTEAQAKAEGYETSCMAMKGRTKPAWFPGSEEFMIKAVARKDGRIIGMQAFGEKCAVRDYIGMASSLIMKRGTIRDLWNIELPYCPDAAELPDAAINAAAFMIRRKS